MNMKLILLKRTFLHVFKILAICLVVFIGMLTLITYMPLKTPLKMFVVLSGSMEPVVPVGSAVLVERQTSPVQRGEVITFIHPNKPVDFVTHRVVGIKQEGNTISYQTRGDANNTVDQWLVKREAVWGKVALVVPLLGYLISFAKTKLGVVVVIVLPLLFIAASEMRVIIKEIRRLKKVKIELPQLDQ